MSQIQAYGVTGGGGAGSVLTITGNAGGPVSPTAGNINLVGAGGVTVTGNPGTSTLTVTVVGGGITWNNVVLNAVALLPNNGYVMVSAGAGVTATLPLAAAFGDIIEIAGSPNGFGWIIAQRAGQVIHFGVDGNHNTVSSTPGVTGSLGSNDITDMATLLCTVMDTEFTVIKAAGDLNVL